MAKIPEPANRPTGKPPGKKLPSQPAISIQSLQLLFDRVVRNDKYRRLIICLGFSLILLHLLEFPHNTFDATHDLSSHATFEYYAANNFQFGTEVYQNVGPYGYVHYAYSYIGYLHWQKIILKSLCRVALVLLIFWMSRGFPNPVLKFCWWASFLVFFPFGDQTQHDYLDIDENYAYLTVYLTALWLLQDRRDRTFLLLSVAAWFFLAFIGLTKHTCFVLACSIVAAVVGQNILRRNFIIAVLGAAAFLVSLLIHWMLAGQHLGNLLAFVRGIFSFSDGYNEAMAIHEPIYLTMRGVTVIVLLAARIIFNWCRQKREWGRAAVEAFLLYVIWKHAFVRADSIHIMILFYAAMLFALPIFFYRTNHSTQPDSAAPFVFLSQKLAIGWCSTVIILCCLFTYAIVPKGQYNPTRLWNNLKHNASWLVSPMRNTREMEAQLRAAKESHTLPQTKALVGKARIDFFGYKPGYILLNDLNYWSRPMPITFAAANPLLQKANEQFYRNEKTAPEFVLCGFGGADDRFFIQDDALAFRSLLDNYRPALTENGMLLLKRREPSELVTIRKEIFLAEQMWKFGQVISCEKLKERVIWLEVKVERNWVGKMVSFFYKTPACYLGFQFEGEEQMRFGKFVTAMGECGFIMNPFLYNSADVVNFYNSQAGPENFERLGKISFVHDPVDKKFFKDEIRLRFYTFERPQAVRKIE